MLVGRAMADLLNRHEAVLVAQGQCHSACTYMLTSYGQKTSYGRKLVTVKIKKAAYRGVVEASTSPSKE